MNSNNSACSGHHPSRRPSRYTVRTVAAAAELGVAFVSYSPLGRGFLTGAFTDASTELSSSDFRQSLPRFTGDNARANAALLAPLRKIAADHGAVTAQIALAWVQHRAPGARSDRRTDPRHPQAHPPL